VAEFHQLAAVPAEAEWFANLDNPRTRRAHRIDLRDCMDFAGIRQPDEFRIVTRAHLLAWRKVLEARALSGATIQRKLAALSRGSYGQNQNKTQPEPSWRTILCWFVFGVQQW